MRLDTHSLSESNIGRSYQSAVAYKAALKQFELRLPGPLKVAALAKLKVTRIRAGVAVFSRVRQHKRSSEYIVDNITLGPLFDDLWRLFLEPVVTKDPDAVHAIALMQHRIREVIKRGPRGVACAIALLTRNIRRAFKYTRAYKDH